MEYIPVSCCHNGVLVCVLVEKITEDVDCSAGGDWSEHPCNLTACLVWEEAEVAPPRCTLKEFEGEHYVK